MVSVLALVSTVVAATPPAARPSAATSGVRSRREKVTTILPGTIWPRISPRGLATEVAITYSLPCCSAVSCSCVSSAPAGTSHSPAVPPFATSVITRGPVAPAKPSRSEEHTSELQSHHDLVCRLLLEKKKKKKKKKNTTKKQ